MDSCYICRRAVCAAVVLAAAYAQSGIAAPADNYPTRPLRIIVPVAPGGGADFAARLLAQKLNEAWDQPVIVDNRPGGAGNVGVALAANSTPDGYTIVLPITSFPINPSLYKKLPFDTVRLRAVARGPTLLLVISSSVTQRRQSSPAAKPQYAAPATAHGLCR